MVDSTPPRPNTRSANARDQAGGRRLLARNAALNIAANMVPLVVGVLTLPTILAALGVERFGILAVMRVVLTAATMLDLGLGRVTTQTVSQALGRGHRGRIANLIWTTTTTQALMGLIAGVGIAAAAPYLVGQYFKVSPPLVPEAVRALRIFAVVLPFTFAASSLRGALEARQRFDLVQCANLPQSVGTYLVPLLALVPGVGLDSLAGAFGAISICTAGAYLLIVAKQFPEIAGGPLGRYTKSELAGVLSFGGWLSVSSIMAPVMGQLEQMVIGNVLSAASVALYSIPSDTVARSAIVPISLSTALLPALSFHGRENAAAFRDLAVFAWQVMAIITTPIAIFITLFSTDILRLWLGQDVARQSSEVMRILAVSAWLNGFAYSSLSVLNALGRPDVKAKLNIGLFFVFLILASVLVRILGINGAALARLIVTAVDAVCLTALAYRILNIVATRRQLFSSASLLALATGSVLCGWLVQALKRGPEQGALAFVIIVTCFLVGAWSVCLDTADKRQIGAWLNRLPIRLLASRAVR